MGKKKHNKVKLNACACALLNLYNLYMYIVSSIVITLIAIQKLIPIIVEVLIAFNVSFSYFGAP